MGKTKKPDLARSFKRLRKAMLAGDAHALAEEALDYTLTYCFEWKGRPWFEESWGRAFRRVLGSEPKTIGFRSSEVRHD